MQNPLLVNGTDIDLWARRHDSQDTLPGLIRRLIEASASGIGRIEFPADEAVQLGGWDGACEVMRGNQYVPDGQSGWELGTGGILKAKADGDYEKRKLDALGLTPAETVFVFVTLRRWSGKRAWVKNRRAEGFWKDVLAYDADDLAAWLEVAVPVHVWLSQRLGKWPVGVADLKTWWGDWSSETTPPLSHDLLLAGRQGTVDALKSWLQEPANVLALQSDSREESTAFFGALAQSLPDSEKAELLGRSLVVSDANTARTLATTSQRLVLIVTSDDTSSVAELTRLGHHVLIPLGQGEGLSRKLLELPKLRVEPARAALEAMGFAWERQNSLAALARRSILAMRRALAANQAKRGPKWAAPENAVALLPALLVGTWKDDNQEDRQALTRIAGQSYDNFERVLVRWEHKSDPPVRRSGSVWALSSKEDAWGLMAPLLTRDQIARFEEVAVEALQELNPVYDLPTDQRILAPILGKSMRYSGLFRSGVADTLALAAGLSDEVKIGGGDTGRDLAARVVIRVMDLSGKAWTAWATLDPVLPLLAEAAPEQFLTALEGAITESGSAFQDLMSDSRTGTMGGVLHTGLLWALENLAWSPDHFSRASSLLAKLAKLDPNPKSNYANRPLLSLRDLYMTWMPQTAAPLERRLRALDNLRKRQSDVSWQLMMSILPANHSVAMPNHSPQHRDWMPEDGSRVSESELMETVDQLVSWFLEDVGHSGERWARLVDAATKLPLAQRLKVFDALAALSIGDMPDNERLPLRDEIRDIISRHREYHDTDWAIPAADVDKLEVTYNRLTVQAPALKHRWLFNGYPRALDVPRHDWQANVDAVANTRKIAVSEIYCAGGLDAVLSFAAEVEHKWHVGVALAEVGVSDQEEATLLAAELGCKDGPHRNLITGYIYQRSMVAGVGWINSTLDSTRGRWSPDQTAAFLSHLNFDRATWDIVGRQERDMQAKYWALVNPWGVRDSADAAYVIGQLSEYGRPYAALHLVDSCVHAGSLPIPAQDVADLIDAAALNELDRPIDLSHFPYELSTLLDFLERSGEVEDARLALLEWRFLLVLEHSRHAKALGRQLAQSPEYFLHLLAFAYKKEGEGARQFSEQEQAIVRNAQHLFDHWSTLPGQCETGIDADALEAWILAARSGAEQQSQGRIADHVIGKLLAHSPAGSDGQWPCEPVRDVIEEVASKSLEDGFEIQVYNSRGVTMRSPYAGGVQERELAAKYAGYADEIGDAWPRTAAVLRRICDYYIRLGEDEDRSAGFGEDFSR